MWLANRHLIALSPHRFYQYGEVENPPTEYEESIGIIGRLHPEGKVLLELLFKAVFQVIGSYILAIFTEKW